ncbi:hypothetical protein NIES4071_18420 [Calothrix sp. NIES-4071]|nr:hypothetical protein NIES4071_18420 [Calothrix sp. NIES-4071]BAZ56175.1 hypothetical protein NIES4105_18370 [Calothrix sp. NIES-4105]
MATCPCCSHRMIRHVRHRQVSWFCRSCWQDMPNIQEKSASHLSLERILAPQRVLGLGASR